MKVCLLPILCLILASCATSPAVLQGSPDYLTVGSVKSNLKGSDFYMAIGNVNLYRHRAFGGVTPTGRSAESAASLQVDRATGRVERIVTLQAVAKQITTTSTTLNTVTTIVENDRSYVLGELIGGISVIDIHPYPTWLDALTAMRKATDALGESGNFRVSTQNNVTTTILPPPFFGWFALPPPHHHRGRYPHR